MPAIVAAVGWLLLWRATRTVDHPLTRLSVDLGPEALNALSLTAAISPDGRRLVYPARGPDDKQLLDTRLLDQSQPTLLPGTENGGDPFFSPNGQWIGFFSGSQLRKIFVQGGEPVILGSIGGAATIGASWSHDGDIVTGIGNLRPLDLTSRRGAAAAAHGARSWRVDAPLAAGLPDGGAVLFTVSPSGASIENAAIEAISLKTGQVKVVQRGGYYGRYLPTGHLV
jgi:serine/threonine-protein kinase